MANTILAPDNAITILRGSSKTLDLSVVDASSSPIDLTGASIYMTVKCRIEDLTNVFQKTTANPAQILITNAKGGLAEITINPVDTQTLAIKDYIFDVWVVLASGKRYVVVGPATFTVQAGVTLIP